MPNTNVADFHLLSKHRWTHEVARIVKASKSSQQSMAEWSAELTRRRRH